MINGREPSEWPPKERPRDIGEHLTKAVRAVVKHNPSLSGVIDVVDFTAERSGERDVNPAKLRDVVETFSDPRHRLGLADVQPDFLGRAYEYLLRQFAEGSGQSAGEFFTPTEVGFLMAHILRPKPGRECHDYACGSAGLLIKLQLVARELDPTSKVPPKLSGQELAGREPRHRPHERDHPRHGGRSPAWRHDDQPQVPFGRRSHQNPRHRPGQHLCARGPRGETFELGQQVGGKRLTGLCHPNLELAVQRVRHVPNPDRPGHVMSLCACDPHVNAARRPDEPVARIVPDVLGLSAARDALIPRSAHTTAALTQWMGGRASKRHSHCSPPSRPIQTWPVVVPK